MSPALSATVLPFLDGKRGATSWAEQVDAVGKSRRSCGSARSQPRNPSMTRWRSAAPFFEDFCPRQLPSRGRLQARHADVRERRGLTRGAPAEIGGARYSLARAIARSSSAFGGGQGALVNDPSRGSPPAPSRPPSKRRRRDRCSRARRYARSAARAPRWRRNARRRPRRSSARCGTASPTCNG